ncbi:erythromycin esterase family protein [Spirillospora sp. NPDC029432]|uniref:erythromycin esterase family protein n=1 Tax=Spirillospora sp. NPDC029432 TaxID=3154599 RepID=UPI003452E46B
MRAKEPPATGRYALRLAAAGVAAGVTATTVAVIPAAAQAGPAGGERAVGAWIDRNAVPLTTDPRAPLDDLGALRGIAGEAAVVGLGESTHGSREQFRAKHRMARYLVERMGFRTIAMEHDFSHGVEIDRYVTTGRGDPREIVMGMRFPFWMSEEILDMVRWMRSYNLAHDRQVRFLGADLTRLRDRGFDEVTGYVRRVAPGRLAELERLLAPLRHTDDGQFEWYRGLTDEQRRRHIEDARAAYDLVREVPATAPRTAREYAEQHARTILGWYESFAEEGFSPRREAFIADTLRWWRGTMGGGRIAYSAASAHTSKAPAITYRFPGGGWRATMAGGHLHDRLGRRYVSIGAVFHQGAITSSFGPGLGSYPIAAPPPGLLDATLGRGRRADYLLDLGAPAPGPVRSWLDAPATARMIWPSYAGGGDGSDHVMTVPSLRGAFDGLVHIRRTTPSRLLGDQEGRAAAGAR